MSTPENNTTHFGFRDVPWSEKARHVRAVFDSVAPKYDLMNDLMSAGLHRAWKRFALSQTRLRPGQRALDVAGGTGDVAPAARLPSGVASTAAAAAVGAAGGAPGGGGGVGGGGSGIDWSAASSGRGSDAASAPAPGSRGTGDMRGSGVPRRSDDRRAALEEARRRGPRQELHARLSGMGGVWCRACASVCVCASARGGRGTNNQRSADGGAMDEGGAGRLAGW